MGMKRMTAEISASRTSQRSSQRWTATNQAPAPTVAPIIIGARPANPARSGTPRTASVTSSARPDGRGAATSGVAPSAAISALAAGEPERHVLLDARVGARLGLAGLLRRLEVLEHVRDAERDDQAEQQREDRADDRA